MASLEVLFRVLPDKISKIDYSIVSDDRIYTPTRFVKFKPNYTRVWTGLGPPTVWHFNNLGYRERDIKIEKPENIFRIAVIGDSLVLGFGVEDFEAFPRRLEQILKPEVFDTGMTHFEVINLGVQGYSSPQYLAVLKEDALRLTPEIVIVTVYPSNDLLGAVGFWKDKKYTNLMAVPDFIPFPINQFLKESSKAYLFLLTKYYTFAKRFQSDFTPSDKSNEEGWPIVESDLKDMQKSAVERGTKLVLLPIPRPKEVSAELNLQDTQKLVDIARRLNIIYYDPTRDLKKYKNVHELYLPDLDDHFSVKGNEYLAFLLAKFLWEEGLTPKQP